MKSLIVLTTLIVLSLSIQASAKSSNVVKVNLCAKTFWTDLLNLKATFDFSKMTYTSVKTAPGFPKNKPVTVPIYSVSNYTAQELQDLEGPSGIREEISDLWKIYKLKIVSGKHVIIEFESGGYLRSGDQSLFQLNDGTYFIRAGEYRDSTPMVSCVHHNKHKKDFDVE